MNVRFLVVIFLIGWVRDVFDGVTLFVVNGFDLVPTTNSRGIPSYFYFPLLFSERTTTTSFRCRYSLHLLQFNTRKTNTIHLTTGLNAMATETNPLRGYESKEQMQDDDDANISYRLIQLCQRYEALTRRKQKQLPTPPVRTEDIDTMMFLNDDDEIHNDDNTIASSSLLSSSVNDILYDIQDCINELENIYVPIQTLSFYNMAITGSWQLLFSTSSFASAMNNNMNEKDDDDDEPQPTISTTSLDISDMIQNINCHDMEGMIQNQIKWHLQEQGKEETGHDDDTNDPLTPSQTATGLTTETKKNRSSKIISSFGIYSFTSPYRLNQMSGSRMFLVTSEDEDHIVGNHAEEEDSQRNDDDVSTPSRKKSAEMVIPTPTLELLKGSAIPLDISNLLRLLHRTIPSELLLSLVAEMSLSKSLTSSSSSDETSNTPNKGPSPPLHAIDTTYVDASIRIVRYTGSAKYDGIRHIYQRMPSLSSSSKN
jgi:hypothetical protein